MNESFWISLTAAGLALIALIIAFLCFIKASYNAAKISNYVAQISELEIARQTDKKMFEELLTRNDDALRRIAWLESRQRQPKTVKEEIEEVTGANFAPAKPTITERRRRVLALAERGQTIETIALTLGMLPGEVELILNLNRTT